MNVVSQSQTIGQLNGPWVRAFKAAPIIGGLTLASLIPVLIWVANTLRDIDQRVTSHGVEIRSLQESRLTKDDAAMIRAEIAALRERLARVPDDLSPGNQLREQIQAIADKQDAMLEQLHLLAIDVAALKRP